MEGAEMRHHGKVPNAHSEAEHTPAARLPHGILWIGFGSFAKRLLPYVEQGHNVEIVSIYHPKRTIALERFGKKGVWDIEKAVSDPKVTAVFITTPNDRHTEYLKIALAHHKNIFVEKPVTALLDDAESLRSQITQNEKVFMVGHDKRRKSGVRMIKNIIENGLIGKPVSAYANLSNDKAFCLDPRDWRYHKKRHREGPLITMGIHLIDILHYLLGPVDSVSATIKNMSGKTEAPDSNALLLNFQNGASAFLESNYSSASQDILRIHGTKATLCLDQGRLYRSYNPWLEGMEHVATGTNDSLKEEIDEFFNSIEYGSRVETDFQTAFNALAIVEASYQSHIEKKTVNIKDITEHYFSA